MRLQRYLNEFNVLGCYLLFDDQINEMSDKTFNAIKNVGKKFGFKIYRSSSVFELLKKYSKKVEDIIRYATLYTMVDVRDKESKKELEKAIKDTWKEVNKKEVADFFMQIDRSLLGIMSIPRHAISSLLGVHITTYHGWKEDKEYIDDSLKKILNVLKKMEKEAGKSLKDEKESVIRIQKNISEL